MKKIKKFGKRIICGLIAAVCMLSFAIPVYADDSGFPLSDISSRYFHATKPNPEWKSVFNKAFYVKNESLEHYYNFILYYEDVAYHCVLTDGDTGRIDWTITDVQNPSDKSYEEYFASKYGRHNYVYLNSSTPSVYSFYSKTGKVNMKDYMISKGYKDADLSKYLSPYKILMFRSDFTLERFQNDGYSVNMTCPYLTPEQLYELLKKDVKPWVKDTSNEPPKFYLKTHNDNGLNKYTEYTLTWVTKGSFVEGKESEYGFKVFIGKERKPLDAKELEATKYSPCLFTSDKLVFTWENVKDLFSFLSTSSLENRFDVFIQITDKTGKSVSDNYIHFLVIKRVEIREIDYVDKNGNIIFSYGKWENGQFKYTDGRETSSEDNSTNSNGSSTAPGSNVSNGDYTDISNAPSSSQIDASATNSLIKTLDTIVSSVSNVPALLAKVYAWLPYQIITLIGTAIGLIVVVGIIKWVL